MIKSQFFYFGQAVVGFENNTIETVQVKSTGCKTKYNVYQVALKSCGGINDTTYKTLINTTVDYLFIYTGNNKMYLILCNEINNKSTLNISNKWLKNEVKIL